MGDSSAAKDLQRTKQQTAKSESDINHRCDYLRFLYALIAVLSMCFSFVLFTNHRAIQLVSLRLEGVEAILPLHRDIRGAFDQRRYNDNAGSYTFERLKRNSKSTFEKEEPVSFRPKGDHTAVTTSPEGRTATAAGVDDTRERKLRVRTKRDVVRPGEDGEETTGGNGEGDVGDEESSLEKGIWMDTYSRIPVGLCCTFDVIILFT